MGGCLGAIRFARPLLFLTARPTFGVRLIEEQGQLNAHLYSPATDCSPLAMPNGGAKN